MKKLKVLGAVFATSLSLTSFAEVSTVAELPHYYNDAISVDKNDQMYVSNYGTGRVHGSVVTMNDGYGNNSEFVANLDGPLGSAFDKNGNFYVSSRHTGEIYRTDRNGRTELFSHIQGGGGIAIDHDNDIYVASYDEKKIYKIDQKGNASVYSDDPLLQGGPVGISFDKYRNLYVGNYDDGKIIKITKKGEVSLVTTLTAGFNNVAYLVFAAGDIYATSIYANKIFKVSVEGEVEVFAGSGGWGENNGENLEATFAYPNGITTNKKETMLYVTEYFSKVVRAISID